APNAPALALAVAVDLAIGDPVYAAHPVRLIGRTLEAFEAALERAGAMGYAGGVALFIALAIVWVGGLSVVVTGAWRLHPAIGWTLHLFLLYSFLALGD